MSFGLSEEHEVLRTTVRRFLHATSPESEVRRLMAGTQGFDRNTWQQMSEQLGLQSLAIPESYGGAGYTFVELAVVLEEMGAALLCAPFLSTVVLAANALLASGDDAAMSEFLPRIADGTLFATVVTHDDAARSLTATLDGVWRVSGSSSYVLDGHSADIILLVADTPEGPTLFVVPGDSPQVGRFPLPPLDQTRRLARLEFGDTPARLIGPAGAGSAVLRRTLDIACVALAVEQTGGAQRCLDSAVAYAKQRVQFDRPIGSFQAIKHMCADMLLDVESARSAAYAAVAAATDGSDDLPLLVSLAKSYCSAAYRRVAENNIQIHGGIGFTWEHSAHLYFKRAVASAAMFGDPAHHRRAMAGLLGIAREGDAVAVSRS
jgi:alkylation response protein AidB-like acyl-CoA dehydrogenase